MRPIELWFEISAFCLFLLISTLVAMRRRFVLQDIWHHRPNQIQVGQVKTIGFSKWSVLTFYVAIEVGLWNVSTAIFFRICSAASPTAIVDDLWALFLAVGGVLFFLAAFTLANVLRWRTAMVDLLVMRAVRATNDIIFPSTPYRLVERERQASSPVGADELGAAGQQRSVNPLALDVRDWQPADEEEGDGVLTVVSRVELAAGGDRKEKIEFTLWTLGLFAVVVTLFWTGSALFLHFDVPVHAAVGWTDYAHNLSLVARQFAHLIPFGAGDFWPALSTDLSGMSSRSALVLMVFRVASAVLFLAIATRIFMVWWRVDWGNLDKLVKVRGR